MRALLIITLMAVICSPIITDGSTTRIKHEPPKLLKYVKKSNPKLADTDAARIAYLIESTARRYNLNYKIFAAILRQESRFQSGIKACHGRGHGCDYGIGQINALWIEEWELDIKRLRYDDEYNIDVAGRILQSVVKRYRRDPKAYSYYHDARPEKRVVYEQHIERVMPKA